MDKNEYIHAKFSEARVSRETMQLIAAERDQLRAEVDRLREDIADRSSDVSRYLAEASEYRKQRNAATARAEASKSRAAGLYRALCDAVRASGGVANEGISDAFLILGVPAEMAARKKAQEAAESTVSGLRLALEEAKKLQVPAWTGMGKIASQAGHDIEDCECDQCTKWRGELIGIQDTIRTALTASPDEYARRIKAEIIQEAADSVPADADAHDWFYMLVSKYKAESDRLEATNGR